MSDYFVGQGKVYAGLRDASGNPLALRFLGNCSKLAFNLKSETLEHKESKSGQRLVDAQISIGKSGSASIVMEDVTAENLAIGLYGTQVAVTGASVSAETLPAALVVGDFVRLANPKVSSVVITDSTGTPKTLTANTNYRLNADHGSIEILDLTTGGPYTQPLKAAYTYASRTDVALFKAAGVERFLRFEGLNMAKSLAPVLVELWRFKSDPLKTLDLIGEKIAELDVEGAVLYDDTKASDATLGQFGRVTLL